MESSERSARLRATPFSANRISPETRACGGSSRMIASEVIDLPEPDSPTRPRTSPGAMEKVRSRTAGKVRVGTAAPGCPSARRAEEENSMFRLRTSRSCGTKAMLAASWNCRLRRPDSRGRLSSHHDLLRGIDCYRNCCCLLLSQNQRQPVLVVADHHHLRVRAFGQVLRRLNS